MLLINSFYLEIDTFKTGSNSGKLAYTFPGILDLVTLTSNTMKSLDDIQFELEVDNGEGQVLGCPKASLCTVTYDWSYTPIWYYISPQVIYPGSPVTLKVNPYYTTYNKGSNEFPIDFRIDDINVDLSGSYDSDSTLSTNANNYVKGKVQNTARTKQADVSAWFNGNGYAMQSCGLGWK